MRRTALDAIGEALNKLSDSAYIEQEAAERTEILGALRQRLQTRLLAHPTGRQDLQDWRDVAQGRSGLYICHPRTAPISSPIGPVGNTP